MEKFNDCFPVQFNSIRRFILQPADPLNQARSDLTRDSLRSAACSRSRGVDDAVRLGVPRRTPRIEKQLI